MVLGCHEASLIATLARHGVVYRVLGHAPCPVFTLAPFALQKVTQEDRQLQQELSTLTT
jgi:hypothetical protein